MSLDHREIRNRQITHPSSQTTNDNLQQSQPEDAVEKAGGKPTAPSNRVLPPEGVLTAALPLPPVYYDPATKDYYMPEHRGGYLRVSQSHVEDYLISRGYNSRAEKDEPLSEVDQVLLEIRSKQNVDYVGALAGYGFGVHNINEHRVLITRAGKPIIPDAGDWKMLESILSNALGPEQMPYLLSWTKVSLNMYRAQRFMPGQALALCGPVECGKTLILNLLVELFGGRVAFPHQYMTGGTSFNSELFEAEIMSIDDEAESIDMRSRKKFAGNIKQVAVTPTHKCHPKGRVPVSLKPLWRMIICLNDEPQRLQVLPPLTPDVADKIMLLKLDKHPMPMPTETPDELAAFFAKLVGELPGFAQAVLDWEIPEAIRSTRYGVAYYHHPDLVDALNQTSAEHHLLEIIDEVLFSENDGPSEWCGRSATLDSILTGRHSPCAARASGLLRHSSSCGSLLGALERQHPERIKHRKSSGHVIWTILRDPNSEPTKRKKDHDPEMLQRLRDQLELKRKEGVDGEGGRGANL